MIEVAIVYQVSQAGPANIVRPPRDVDRVNDWIANAYGFRSYIEEVVAFCQ